MAKRKRKLSPEERAILEVSYRETVRKLEERIAYHRARLAEEQAGKR